MVVSCIGPAPNEEHLALPAPPCLPTPFAESAHILVTLACPSYLDRMNNLLAEDASISHISWDGREYFAEVSLFPFYGGWFAQRADALQGWCGVGGDWDESLDRLRVWQLYS